MGSQDEDPKLGMAPTAVGAVGTVASQPTIAAGSIASQPTMASEPRQPAVPSGIDPTVASFDRGLPQLTPSRMVVVQADMYQRLDELARGGLGRISRARDVRSGRTVAIKEMIASTEDAAVRFAREAMITANLEHPAIVPVYEVGRWPSGEPFFAMKLVKGRPLNVVIEEAQDLDARLALVSHVLTVADALAYAHGEKIIHRDLKPHNVLCGAHGETVVIDWGLARRIDEEETTYSLHRRISAEPGQTYVGAIMGTPAYMPPEQARGKRVDERADVYAIGAMLYHLLSGRPAYAGKTLDELIEKVRSGPPAPLVELVPEVPPDLAAIVIRAMAPEASDRYPTALELATDLRRFTTGQLVLAHRYTRGQRIRRFVAKHRGAVTISVLALAALVVGGAFSVASIVSARDDARSEQGRAESERGRADRERDEVRRQLVAAHTDRARVELSVEHPREALAFLAAAGDIAGLDANVRYLAARALSSIPSGKRFPELDIQNVEFIPGSHDLVIGSGASLIRWNPASDAKVWENPGKGGDVLMLGSDRLIVGRERALIVLDLATGKEIRKIEAPSVVPLAGLLGHDHARRWIAAVTLAGVELFDLQANAHVASIKLGPNNQVPLVSPDGQHLAVGMAVSDVQNKLQLVDRTGRVLAALCNDCRTLRAVIDGIAITDYRVGEPNHVKLFDWSGKQLLDLAPASVAEVTEIAQSPDGRWLAIFLSDGMFEMHEVGKGLRWRQTISDRAYEAKFDARGRLWLLGSYVSTHLYDAATGIELARWALGGFAMRISDDGDQIAVATPRIGVTSWSVQRGAFEVLAPSAARVRKVVFDGDRLFTSSDDGLVSLYEPGKPVRTFAKHQERVTALQVVGAELMTSSRDNTTVIRDASTGAELERHAVGPRAALSPDGAHLALSGLDGNVSLVDRKTKASRVIGKFSTEVSSIRWTPDGSKFAAIDNNSMTMVWSADGTKVKDLPSAETGIDVVFSNDSKWMGIIGGTPQAIVHSVEPGVPARVLEPTRMPSVTMSVAFSPGDSRVAFSDQGRVRIWKFPQVELETTIPTGTEVVALAWSPDGTLLYGAGVDRKVHAWEIPRGLGATELGTVSEVYGLTFDPKRPRMALVTLGAAMLWNLDTLTLDLPKLRALVSCLDERDPVTGETHRIDVAACNRITAP
ncbi:MAG: protein kinase [Myxococcales bacterium]|nr:protein kinase [Myxococcales bacterium]